MNDKMTVEQVRELLREARDAQHVSSDRHAYGRESVAVATLAISQHEELERLRAELETVRKEIANRAHFEESYRIQIAERDAQLAECIHFIGLVSEGGQPYKELAVECLNDIPTSAKHNAEILRAAEDWRDAIEERDRAYDDGMPPWTYANKAAKAEKALFAACEAVRAKKAVE